MESKAIVAKSSESLSKRKTRGMEINEFISSGIIEMYCLGIATEVEREQVEKFAKENNAVRDEILIIREALELYAMAGHASPPATLKNKIMAAIMNSEKQE